MFIEALPLEELLSGGAEGLREHFEDEGVTDLFFRGHDKFSVEKEGQLLEITSPFVDRSPFDAFIERMVIPTGRRLDSRYPFLEGALGDGSRFHAVFSPAAAFGTQISIRKLRRSRDLALADFGGAEVAKVLERAGGEGENILVCGGTGSGKTSLVGLLMDSIPPGVRWIVIEEFPEIVTQAHHVVRLQGRPSTADGVGEITLRMLVKNALRMRPDRLVLGECRGPEAFDMLQALMSGHSGSLATIHASSARGALARLETLIALAGNSLSAESIRLWISQCIRWVIHLEKHDGRRQLAEAMRIEGLEMGRYRVSPVFGASKRLDLG